MESMHEKGEVQIHEDGGNSWSCSLQMEQMVASLLSSPQEEAVLRLTYGPSSSKICECKKAKSSIDCVQGVVPIKLLVYCRKAACGGEIRDGVSEGTKGEIVAKRLERK